MQHIFVARTDRLESQRFIKYTLCQRLLHCGVKARLVQVLLAEQDLSTKRNAFQMLCNHSQSRAVSYLLNQVDNVAHWGDILQMAVLELIRKARLPISYQQPPYP